MDTLILIVIFAVVVGYALWREYTLQSIIYISGTGNNVDIHGAIRTYIEFRNSSNRVIKSANLVVTAFDDLENVIGKEIISFYNPVDAFQGGRFIEVCFGTVFSDAVLEERKIIYKLDTKKILFTDGKIRKSLNI